MLKKRKQSKLYFDQYRYGLNIKLELASVIRGFSGIYAVDYVKAERQFDWREEMALKHRGITEGISDDQRWPVYSLLETFCGRIQEHGRDFKVVIGFGQVWIYANDLHWINDIAHYYHVYSLTEIDLAYPPDTVAVVRPTGFQYRTYLKQKNLSIENAGYLRNWLKNQANVRLSEGLHVWTVNNWRDTSGNYFFDHNDKHIPTLLNITVPNMIKKTKTIIVVDK